MEPELALDIIHRARQLGREHNLQVTVAVHDAAGHPVALLRGSAQRWHGPYMAMGKARLAAAFQRPTAELIEMWRDRPMFPASLIEIIPGGVTVNPGGHPIFQDGECIGAVGVGGGSPDQDGLVARLTVEALLSESAPVNHS